MKSQEGFTLIELMIVIAIIGILASVAIPNYQNYVLRTEAGSSLSAARPLQIAVGEYVARFGSLPSDHAALATYTGVPNGTDNALGNVSDITIGKNGLLTITFATFADGVPNDLAGLTYTLTPNAVNGESTWKSAVGTLDPKYLPRVGEL